VSQVTTRRRALRPSGKLLQEDARRHHRALILQRLFAEGPASRADLARSTGLTRVTVSDLVAELIEDDLLRELGAPVESRVGKPPTLVGLHHEATHIVTLDLSIDDRLTGAVVTLDGVVKLRDEQELGGAKGDAAVALLHNLTRRLVESAPTRILGVGVGSPGIVDDAGNVVDAPNLGWSDLALADGLRAAFDLPVYVANDANTAVLGEHTYGESGEGGLMLLRVGTGVGAGLVLEGALLHGHVGAAGEIGHVVVDPAGAPCACGRTGCLETVVAVPHLRRRVAEAADPGAELSTVGEQLGAVLAPVVGTLNLHELVLTGPQELLDGPLLAGVDSVIRQRTMPITAERLVVRTSRLGDDVVLLGGAVLVLAGELGVS
jgi:predicted NBD/HSP70 family sugar kinase